MTKQQLAIDCKRSEADSLIRLAMRLENITPNVQMAMYEPRTAILIETAIRLQDEANRLEGIQK